MKSFKFNIGDEVRYVKEVNSSLIAVIVGRIELKGQNRYLVTRKGHKLNLRNASPDEFAMPEERDLIKYESNA